MKKKCRILAAWSFVLSLAIFAFTYVLHHYTLPGGAFTAVRQPTPAKPFVTLLFGVWGTLFLFAGVMSLLAGRVFFGKEKNA